ncbi:hypothetical protein HOY82DRAFT_534455 [Tuber indicum]|nr:hypothetical protein HOY82DRAFT_534455 [Tuber indicum]
MSQQSQTTDSIEVDLHHNTWDFQGELVADSVDHLGSGYLHPISELSDGDSTSAHYSAPSGMLTPTLEALSNMGSIRNPDPAERLLYERKKKIRKLWVYWSQKGSEYVTRDGRTRWRCTRCSIFSFNMTAAKVTNYIIGPSPQVAVTFVDSSTKNMIEHLYDTHKMTKDGPLTIQLEKDQLRVETAFGNTTPQIIFNEDILQEHLVR